ncbi:ArsC/Spx/MgsR family protein [Sediminimonas sp.]|uniref:ArsC/Spx/MgsR family protein n=1 Tax=Sediminimonas sp. TaxID=2823379 RepID=UPI0025F7DF66|nr:ArsC/Spx/MgsR family protein [Sediminimonas sp.]
MKVYGLMTCDTCTKARKALPNNDFVDIRKDGLPHGLLERALTRFGDALVNRRSTTWRGLSEAERARQPAALLSEHPALMKRPLIEDDHGDLHLGWGVEVRKKLLG